MKIGTALSETAAACGTNGKSLDRPADLRGRWMQLEQKIWALSKTARELEAADEHFKFSPEVGFPSPTNEHRVVPS